MVDSGHSKISHGIDCQGGLMARPAGPYNGGGQNSQPLHYKVVVI